MLTSFWLIVNLQTGKVVYSSELLIDPKKVSTENNRAFVSEIQANDKIVAIKSSQTLFIFEKEETILQ
ncbi:hypothetical protein [Gelidibacter algens]|uniref:hypothetical protein n=1 Tax=Gelidibacter algens TaxID=49280 RepID=UPI0012F780F6|nr:hypothetical protein [Gelidibacter algens]